MKVTAEHPQGLNLRDAVGRWPKSIKQETVFEVQWTDCPTSVEDEVRELWEEYELGNDTSYFKWSGSKNLKKRYPLITKFLKKKNVDKCLIHWWW